MIHESKSSYLGRATCGSCCWKRVEEKEADTCTHSRSPLSPSSSSGSLLVSLHAPGTPLSTNFLVSSCGREGTANARVSLCCAAATLSVLRTNWKKSERKGTGFNTGTSALSRGSEDPSSDKIPRSHFPASLSKTRQAAGETVRWWWGWHLTNRDFLSLVWLHGKAARSPVAEFVYFCALRYLIFIWIDPS